MRRHEWKCANCHKPVTLDTIEVSVERSFGSLRTCIYTKCCLDEVINDVGKDVTLEITDALVEGERIARRGY